MRWKGNRKKAVSAVLAALLCLTSNMSVFGAKAGTPDGEKKAAVGSQLPGEGNNGEAGSRKENAGNTIGTKAGKATAEIENPAGAKADGETGNNKRNSVNPDGTAGNKKADNADPDGKTGDNKTDSANPDGTTGNDKTDGTNPDGTTGNDKTDGSNPDGTAGDDKTDSLNPDGVTGNDKTDSANSDGTVGNDKTNGSDPDGTAGNNKTDSAKTDNQTGNGKADSVEAGADKSAADNSTGTQEKALQKAGEPVLTSNTGIETNVAYNPQWSGQGTQGDPFYVDCPYTSNKKDTFIANTTDVNATINGQVHEYTQPLKPGDNTVELTVVSSDKTKTTYYKLDINRAKKQQDEVPGFLSVISPSAAGASDGRLEGLDTGRAYEYRAAGQYNTSQDNPPWIKIPEGTSSIDNLKAGDYQVRYSETDEVKAGYRWGQYTIKDPSPYSITVDSGVPKEITDILVIPGSANEGSTVILQMNFAKRTFVEEINVKSTIYFPNGMYTYTERNLLSSAEKKEEHYDDNTYTLKFNMPAGEMEIQSVKLRTGDWQTVSFDPFRLKVKVTPEDTNKALIKGDVTYYEKGSRVQIEAESNQNVIGTSELVSFRVVDTDGDEAGVSADGSPIWVTIDRDLTVTADIRMIYADFTALDDLLANRVPKDLTLFTDDTWSEVSRILTLEPNIRTVTQNSQYIVDDYVKELEEALDNLVYRDGDYTKILEAQNRVPKDLSIYTDETVQALQKALEASKKPVDEQWNMSRRDEITKLAGNLDKAVDDLKINPADYAKVKTAREKVPKDLSIYTDASVGKLKDALGQIVEGLDITHQDEVDRMAANIEKAIAGLEKKPKEKTPDKNEKNTDKKQSNTDKKENKKTAGTTKETKSPKTSDETQAGAWAELGMGGLLLFLGVLKKKNRAGR